MGYTTDFEGRFNLNKKLTKKLSETLTKFAGTRRMARRLGPEFGIEGEFYVEGTGDFGQTKDPSIIDFNRPPCTQPGLWCQWVPTPDDKGIMWDGGEKFYEYVAWLEYLIKNFLAPNKYKLNGEVIWQGEESYDRGKIVVKNNIVTTKQGSIVYR